MARRRSGKKIDFTHWIMQAAAQSAFAAGTGARTILAAQHLPETILRMRGEYLVYVDAAQAPGGSTRVSSGLILVPEGTGTTVLWSPETDSDAPWIWYDVAHIGYEEMVTDVVDVPAITSKRVEIDSKSMRIVKNMELQWVVESVSILTAVNVNTALGVRVLSGT